MFEDCKHRYAEYALRTKSSLSLAFILFLKFRNGNKWTLFDRTCLYD